MKYITGETKYPTIETARTEDGELQGIYVKLKEGKASYGQEIVSGELPAIAYISALGDLVGIKILTIGQLMTPWNWCPGCKQMVDLEESTAFDGEEVVCAGCQESYTCVSLVDGSWVLEKMADAS